MKPKDSTPFQKQIDALIELKITAEKIEAQAKFLFNQLVRDGARLGPGIFVHSAGTHCIEVIQAAPGQCSVRILEFTNVPGRIVEVKP